MNHWTEPALPEAVWAANQAEPSWQLHRLQCSIAVSPKRSWYGGD